MICAHLHELQVRISDSRQATSIARSLPAVTSTGTLMRGCTWDPDAEKVVQVVEKAAAAR
jgi:hypothetical protein